jgi:hypothetical protein
MTDFPELDHVSHPGFAPGATTWCCHSCGLIDEPSTFL